jgi:hypothetical protein
MRSLGARAGALAAITVYESRNRHSAVYGEIAPGSIRRLSEARKSTVLASRKADAPMVASVTTTAGRVTQVTDLVTSPARASGLGIFSSR